jgi:hypothetical protein
VVFARLDALNMSIAQDRVHSATGGTNTAQTCNEGINFFRRMVGGLISEKGHTESLLRVDPDPVLLGTARGEILV